MRLVFCNVGQGDGIYIDLPDGSDVLIDGGPDKKMLECLGRNMPFWDRKIEMIFLTHPEADHLNGLVEVLGRYDVEYFVSSPIGNNTKGYQSLVKTIEEKKVQIKNAYAGEIIKFKTDEGKEAQFRILWPSREFLKENISQYAYSQESLGNILGVSTNYDNLNDFSTVLELKFGDFEALLGGDADQEIQDDILRVATLKPVEVFKIPHHGSKYGIFDEYLEKANPDFAVVSVGKNPWGHPTKEILQKFKSKQIPVYRTDQQGEIKFTTDGKQIEITSDKKQEN